MISSLHRMPIYRHSLKIQTRALAMIYGKKKKKCLQLWKTNHHSTNYVSPIVEDQPPFHKLCVSNCGRPTTMGMDPNINVVKSVANGLFYMHHDCSPPIIHRDISTNNILLDSNLEAVVSDFGTARLLNPDSSNQTLVAGTYGYIATFSRGGFSIGSVGAPALAEKFFEKKFPLGPRGLELRAKLCSH